jgi:hypothetical protein
VNRRVSEVTGMLASGYTRQEILQYGIEAGWAVSTRQMDEYIHRGNAAFQAQCDRDRKREFGRALVRLDDIYKRSLELKRYATCLHVVKEVNTMLGLYADRTVTPDRDMEDMTDQELKDILLESKELVIIEDVE